MKLDVRVHIFAVLLMSLVVGSVRNAGAQAPAGDPDDVYWEEGQSLPGVDGPVTALTEWNGHLVAGGTFTAAGDVLASNIALWDGAEWSAFGSNPGFDGGIRTLAVFEGQVIAGGSFTTAGGVVVNRIAAWDGSSWLALGAGFDATVNTLTVYNDQLIAGGHFTTSGDVPVARIAAWDGTSWSALGGGVNEVVNELVVYEDKLIAAGSFTTAGDASAHRIAAWDGSTWSVLGAGIVAGVQSVWALAVGNGMLYASLYYDEDFLGNPLGQVAAWNGYSWDYMGGDAYYALAVFNGVVYGASWSNDGVYSAGIIKFWSGSSWSILSEFESSVYVLGAYDGHLVAGGRFRWSGRIPALSSAIAASNIVAWNGSWSAFGAGMMGPLYSLASYSGELVAFEPIVIVSTMTPEHFVRPMSWNGESWSPLGGSMFGGEAVFGQIEYGTQLIAGGSFRDHLVGWNGSSWLSLGDGPRSTVRALAVYGGRLIAGGEFTYAGSGPANRVAAWDGSTWSPLGSGLNGIVNAVTVHHDRLIVGGSFTWAGGQPANRIAAWNGSTWSPLGSGMSDYVYALTVFEDQLIAGGSFTTAGGSPVNRIAAWNGSSWSALGDGTQGTVWALGVYDDRLIAAGAFTMAGGLPANRIAAWDGSSWSALGSGLNGNALALAVHDDKLYVGGAFTRAGGKVASYLVAWTRRDEVPVFITRFDAVEGQSGVDLVWEIAADEEISGFKIYRKLEGSSTGEVVVSSGLIPPGARSYTDRTVSTGKSYEYTLVVVLPDRSEVRSRTATVRTKSYALELDQNAPNPFNPTTTISFTLPERSRVRLAIYDVEGRIVSELIDDVVEDGYREYVWDGKNSEGNPVSSGVYFYRLTVGDRTLTKKMVCLK